MRRFLHPSTLQFVQEARALPDYSLFDLFHGYVYGRWPHLYIAIATGEHPLSRLILPVMEFLTRTLRRVSRNRPRVNDNQSRRPITIADAYHGKVVPLNAAVQLVTVNRDIRFALSEHVIPYPVARDIVLQNPDHIMALECPCRSARKKPCTPLDVCLVVGEPFAAFIAEHRPDRSRRITPAEAVEILRAEDERGHVHHAFFKDAMLGRFYAICNCCRCCCGALQAHRHGSPMLAASGYIASVDRQRCVGCGTCAKYCQFEAVLLIDGIKTVDTTKCMGCGVCAPKCRQGAISLVRDSTKGIPLEMEELMAASLALH
jgi:Pyruvate/2-oxoacid:ferredoxin oxidoreductase delta subunit